MRAVLITELLDMLMRLKFAARLSQAGLSTFGIVSQIWRIASIVTPTSVPQVVIDDPDDDYVLACALAAHADLIVPRDSDLLNLERFQNIDVLEPALTLTHIAR